MKGPCLLLTKHNRKNLVDPLVLQLGNLRPSGPGIGIDVTKCVTEPRTGQVNIERVVENELIYNNQRVAELEITDGQCN